MTVTLVDNRTSTELELFNTQDLSNDRQAATDVKTPTGFDSEDAFITSLEQSASASLRGAVTAGRLTGLSRYDNDPQVALGEWAAQLEEFVNGGPGNGYTLKRGYRSDQFTGVAESITWVWRGGEPRELGFNVEFVRGQAAGTTTAVSDVRGSIRGPAALTIDGTSVGPVDEFQMTKDMPLETYRRALADNPDSDNDLFANAGAVRTIRVTGQVTGSVADRNQFDADMTAKLGQDESVPVVDPLTGREFDCTVSGYETTDEAGVPRVNDFGIELVEGDVE